MENVADALLRALGDGCVPLVSQQLDDNVDAAPASPDGEQLEDEEPLVRRRLHPPDLGSGGKVAVGRVLGRKENGVAAGWVEPPNQGRLPEEEDEIVSLAIEPHGSEASAPELRVQFARHVAYEQRIPSHRHEAS
jgi:hypothetical protein